MKIQKELDRQNNNYISVILGNPPYNANQANENDNNKNREYPEIDKRIKNTYIKNSVSQKTKLYDMYSRFIRWATDRLDKNGIIAFITNSSFVDARTFDGFRNVVAQEFSDIYIIDLGGNVRVNPKLSGTIHNVFGIQTGVAIFFMIRKVSNDQTPCKIFYSRRPELEVASNKLKFLAATKFTEVDFTHTIPDKQNNWINQTNNDFDELLTLIDKDVKAGKSKKAIFKLYSNGVNTARDEWVYDRNQQNIDNKIQFFINIYNSCIEKMQENLSIKWSASLKKYAKQKRKLIYQKSLVQKVVYRPFIKMYHYTEKCLNDRLTNNHYEMFSKNLKSNNLIIAFSGVSSSKPFQCFVSNLLIGFDTLEKTQCFSLYSYNTLGNRIDNITDWGLKQFHNYYEDEAITKLDIFHYTYAVLHNPPYREKYELNLKREFPRIPFYDNFHQWADWGRQLMDLHINYEIIEPYALKRIDIPSVSKTSPKVKLKADRDKGIITLDADTSLHGVPPEAWEYELGNRSALEWILDQYKEKKPKDKTIAEKFNTYRFADYKEQVIDLLQRVCTVSVETMKIIKAMQNIVRHGC